MVNTMSKLSRRKFLQLLVVGAGATAAKATFPLNSLYAQVQYENKNGILVTKKFPANRPYWDMPVNQDSRQTLSKTKKTLEYQLNPYHQPNEIYGKETCHGGGDYDGFGIGQSDVDAAQVDTDHFALDVTGNNIINAEDATEIQNYLDKTITYLQSHWNFLTENEKLSWFTRLANIYTVDQKQYIEGDESTRYTSGQFATEFVLRMQGYNKNLLDLLGEVRGNIPDKYNESFEINGRGNIPAYFIGVQNLTTSLGHGMVGLLIGNDPLNFNHWIWYEPQTNKIVMPEPGGTSIPFNSELNIYKMDNFGNSSGGSDMFNFNFDTKALIFNIDSSGNSSVPWKNDKLLLEKPTVAIEDENSSIPQGYSLEQNYPNPFNPKTNIKFDIPKEEHVNFTIYDSNGKKVRTLLNEKMFAGPHEISWDPKDNLPSGVYLGRLQAGNYVKTQKMTYTK